MYVYMYVCLFRVVMILAISISVIAKIDDVVVVGSSRTDERVEVLSSHLQLQKDGFLSSWTNSFVGPWDPSQGMHNPGKQYAAFAFSLYLLYNLAHLFSMHPDDKIKLWLFLPGRHSSVADAAQPALSRLKGTFPFFF